MTNLDENPDDLSQDSLSIIPQFLPVSRAGTVEYYIQPERILNSASLSRFSHYVDALDKLTSQFDISIRRRQGRREVVIRNFYGKNARIIDATDLEVALKEIVQIINDNSPLLGTNKPEPPTADQSSGDEPDFFAERQAQAAERPARGVDEDGVIY